MDIIKSTLGSCAVHARDIDVNGNIYAPGYLKVASCKSEITFIDGEKGLLLHRGYEIGDLVANRDYIDLCYLLLHNKLPTTDEYIVLGRELGIRASRFPLKKLVLHSCPMKSLSSAMLALGDHISMDNFEKHDRFMDIAYDLLAYMPTIIFHIINDKSDISEIGFLEVHTKMLANKLGVDASRMLDIWHKILIVHADHEQNASTSTVRLACSTGADVIMSMVAGISSLAGPKHGAANVFVMNMFNDIGSVENIDSYMQDVQDKKKLLYGFGHRVYKNFDPRSKILKSIYQELNSSAKKDVLFDIAEKLCNRALNDEYFVARKLYPNVDFYSGLTLRSLGVHDKYFTTIFAFGRLVGWLSQMHEHINDKEQKIGRPFQIYTGSPERPCPSRE